MPANGTIDNFWAVIPAGGAGTRLWPLSRSHAPKFLHDLTGSGMSLLQETWARLAPLAEERFIVVTGRVHRSAVAEQLPALGSDAVLAEPSPRDSMAAIGLAAALLERDDPEAVMGSFAADHVIDDPEAFGASVRVAVEAARDGWLVTLGIEPSFPSSAFGYIAMGDELPKSPGVRAVRAFVEKPSTEVARTPVTSAARRPPMYPNAEDGNIGSMPSVTSQPSRAASTATRTDAPNASGSSITWSAANEPITASGSSRSSRAAARPIAAIESRGRRLGQHGVGAEGRQLLGDGAAVRPARHDHEPLLGGGASRAQVSCSSDMPLPVRSCRNLGAWRARERPEPGPAPPAGITAQKLSMVPLAGDGPRHRWPP